MSNKNDSFLFKGNLDTILQFGNQRISSQRESKVGMHVLLRYIHIFPTVSIGPMSITIWGWVPIHCVSAWVWVGVLATITF